MKVELTRSVHYLNRCESAWGKCQGQHFEGAWNYEKSQKGTGAYTGARRQFRQFRRLLRNSLVLGQRALATSQGRERLMG